MTPQEKANELVEKFKEHSQLMIGYGGFASRNASAQQCALIAVDEVVLHCNQYEWQYWEEVKQQIKNL